MSDVNANIHIGIDSAGAYAELRRLQTEISSFNKSLATANASAAAQASALNKALKDGVNATGMFEARIVPVVSGVERFTHALENNKLSLGEYTKYAASQMPGLSRIFRKEFDTMESVATDRVKKIQTQYVALGKSAKGMQEALAMTPTSLAGGYSTQMAIATQKQQMFNKLIDDGSTKLLNWGKNTQWAGRQLMVGFSIPLAALGTVAAKTFMELDKASTAFERVYGDLSTTTAEMERNKAAVMSLGSEYTKYGIAVKDTVDLSARVAATGLTNNDMLAATEQTLRFATLGQMDYQQALDATISLQSAFDVSSKDLASTIDYLNAVENQTVLTIQDMAAAIPRVAPVIKGLGGDVRDLAVMMTAMKEGGVTAENAANALKSGLASLINPTDRAMASMQKLGINMQAIIDTNRGDLLGTVKAFGDALSKVDEFSQQQALEQIFGKYQYARMGALFKNIADGASQASRAMDLAGMSAEQLGQISEKELGSIAESTTVKFQAAMEQLKLSIAPLGEAFLKGIMPIMDFLTKIANAFNGLPDPIKNAVAVITGVVAGLGPVFLMTIGLIGNGFANLIKGIQFFRKRIAGIKGDASAFQYFANAELEAKTASEQLEGSVVSLTGNLVLQRRAVQSLITQYGRYAQAAGIAGAAAATRGRTPIKMARGGMVPGSGSGDKIPALLTPGETVVTKGASQKYGPVIAAMNAGTLQGFEDGLDSGKPLIPEGAKIHGRSDAQSIIAIIESYKSLATTTDQLADIEKRVAQVFSRTTSTGELMAVSASNVEKALKGVVPPLVEIKQVGAHLTEMVSGGMSESGVKFLAAAKGQGAGSKSLPAQRILDALSETPELEQFIKEYSGLTASLSKQTNRSLTAKLGSGKGVPAAAFMEEFATGGKTLGPSLQKFGDYIPKTMEQTKALATFEEELAQNIEKKANTTNDGLVVDQILIDETESLIKKYEDAGGAMGEVAVAARKAKTAVAQVSLDLSTQAGQEFIANNPEKFITEGDNTYYKTKRGEKGAFVSRRTSTGTSIAGERVGSLAVRAGAVQGQEQTAALKRETGVKSPSTEGEYVSEMVAQGQLEGAKKNVGVSAQAGRVAGAAQIDAMKQELAGLRQASGMSPKEQYKRTQSETRALDRVSREMGGKGYSQEQIERTQRKILAIKIAELRAAEKSLQLESQISRTKTQTLKNEEKRSLLSRLSSGAGGIGKGIAGRAGTVGMGLGMASMIPMMMQNDQGQFMGMNANNLAMGMGTAGMGLDMVGMMQNTGIGARVAAMLAPLGISAGAAAVAFGGVTVAVGAAALAYKIWRNNVDDASRAAAEFGANLGGTSNALNNMAKMLGTQTPAQRAAQLKLGVTQDQQEGISQWQATFESGAGKQFIDELKAATSEERFKKLTDYIKAGIASGMMDKSAAESFANSVALTLGDSVLGIRAKNATAGQGTGTQAMLDLARQRVGAVRGSEAYNQVGFVRSNTKDQYSSTEATNADQVISGSMQIVQDFANASALASEELASGKITQSQYEAAVKSANEAIARSTFDMKEAMLASDDLGGSMQGLVDQLKKAGLSAEDAAYISEITAKQGMNTRVGKYAAQAGPTTAQMRSEAASAAMQGMSVENIKAITEYMQGDKGAAVAKRFAEVSGNKASAGQAYGIAGLQTSIEQGALGQKTPDQVDAIMNIATQFVNLEGTAADFQQFLMSLPSEVDVTAVLPTDPAAQKQFIDTYNKLLPSLGNQTALDVTKATGGEVPQATIDAANQLKQIFGSDQTTIDRYINIGLKTDPPTINDVLPEITKNMQDINDKIPPDIQKLIGIDLKNPQDVEKYGPLADDINSLVPAINALPEGQKEFAVSIMMKQNGKEVKDPIKFAKDMVKYQKTLAGLSSGKMKVRKESAIQLITTIYDQDGKNLSPEEAKSHIENLTKELGITENEFLQLPPDTISKLFVLDLQIQTDQATVDAAKAYYDSVVANGGSPNAIDAAAASYKAAQEALAASKKSAKATAAAGMIQGGNDIGKGGGGGGGGGGKSNPWKDFLSNILTQVQTFSDINAKMSDLFKGKTDLVSLLKKSGGLDDQIRKMGLSPRLADMLRGMDPKDAKVVLGKIKSTGKKAVENTVLANAVNQTKDDLTNRITAASAQRRASVSLAGRGVKGDVIGTITSDPEASRQYLDLLKNAEIAQKKYENASKGHRKALKKEWQDANAEVRKFLNLYSKANVAERAQAYEADKRTRQYDISSNSGVLQQLQGAGITQDQISSIMGNEAVVGKLSDAVREGKNFNVVLQEQLALMQQEAQLDWNLKGPHQQMLDIIDAQQQVLDLQKQRDELMRITPIQNEIDAIQKEIDGLQSRNDELSRAIELRQRDLEAIDDSISKLEEQKDAINKLYDDRIKALDEIEKANQRIYAQQKGQLSIAQALSSGDVAGAAKAMQDLQMQMAQDRSQATKDALELSRQRQLETIDVQINSLKEQRKVIENDIKKLQMDQRSINDQIYAKQQSIKVKSDQIKRIQEEINNKYNNQELALIAINEQLAIAQAHWEQISRLSGNAGAAAGTATANNTPTTTVQPNGTINYSGYDTSATNSLWQELAATGGYTINGVWTPAKYAMGGMVPKYFASGGMSRGTDTVPAMLTPGEFVMRKPAVDRFGSAMFQSLNMGAMPRFNTPAAANYGLTKADAESNGAVYNYDISVNVDGTTASADDIANVVLSKIKMTEDRRIRSNRY